MKFDRAFLLPGIAAALALLVYLMPGPSPSLSLRPPSRVAVSQASYACPAGRSITVAAGQIRPGTESSATLLPGRVKDAALAGASTWRTSVVNGSGVIVEQQGRRSGPGGFFAGRAAKNAGGGLVVGSCPGIVEEAWLLGLGSGGKHFSTLILTNVADTPAVVDLDLWGPKGKIDAVDAKGIVVKPFATRRVRLDTLAAGEAELAMRVHRRRGSLSAVVNDTSTATFRGTESVTATASPRRDQVVSGIIRGAAGRTLELLNPGGTTARVDVSVLGPKNEFKPSGLSSIKVRAGALRLITVPRSAGSGRQALRVTSDLPVAATVRMAPSNSDYAYAESVPPLAGPALAPVELGASAGAPDLILSAPKGDAGAEIQAFDAKMQPVFLKTIAIKAGTTQHVNFGTSSRGKNVAYLVVRPKGNVSAAATYSKGSGISSLALIAAPVTVLGPQVRPLG